MSKTIGILGGMGPKATVYLFDLIVDYTAAKSDDRHIPIIIFNNPKIPDRTEAILQQGPSPLALLIEGAKLLEQAGADFIVMPCATAHYYYADIIKHIDIPFIHLIEETGLYLDKRLPRIEKIGLLATDGTIAAHIFQGRLEKRGMEIITPDRKNQERVMASVYGREGVKAGFVDPAKTVLQEVVIHLINRGSQAVIAGCTEVPLALDSEDIPIPLIDPLDILARRAVVRAGHPLKRK